MRETESSGRPRGRTHTARRVASVVAIGLVSAIAPHPAQPVSGDAEWVEVDYRALVDARRLSHSGEPVALLLDKLGGRPRPAPGQRRADAIYHSLLDPLLEPFAFVLPDVVDAESGSSGPPFIDVGSLWSPGEAQPAWAELVRSRRLLIESDGAGRVRVFAPLGPASRATAALDGSAGAGRRALDEAWPVLRHALSALSAGRDGESRALTVAVHPYDHRPARTRFRVGLVPHRVELENFGPAGDRAPLDFAALTEFLDEGWQIEGGRLSPDGELTLLGSRPRSPPTILGRPVSLADLAVAYRAVFHSAGDEPYMSLDRAHSPHVSLVSYGGRLRDTAIGMVSLLCDIRFKTFSAGVDVLAGEDVRDRVKASIPGFMTHMERFGADPTSSGVLEQQTRLWFYPDSVELTLSPRGDLMALRRARMSAASERVEATTWVSSGQDDPPWTRVTIEGINEEYARLARLFPELGDLDQVVRLLSMFAWLQQAERSGLPIPELDALLSVELPSVPTPRTFPQLLTFNALARTAGQGVTDLFDRSSVGRSLDRLQPSTGVLLPAARRFRRAGTTLDPRQPEQAALVAEFRSLDPATADSTTLDLLAYRAERLLMHRLTLGTLPPDTRSYLTARQTREGGLRVFSLGIGGLDLSMTKAIERASGRAATISFGAGAARASTVTARSGAASAPSEAAPAASRAPRVPPPEWKRDPEGTAQAVARAHGLRSGDAPDTTTVPVPGGKMRMRVASRWTVATGEAAEAGRTIAWEQWWSDLGGPELSGRRVVRVAGGPPVFERVESGRFLRYRLEGQGVSRVARPADAALPLPVSAVADAWPRHHRLRPSELAADDAPLPAGLAVVEIGGEDAVDGVRVPLRMRAGASVDLSTEIPRTALWRAALGPETDPSSGRPLTGFAPLPPQLGAIEQVMLMLPEEYIAAPWTGVVATRPGEEDATRLAEGLGSWSAASADGTSPPAAVVGIDVRVSPRRWSRAPERPVKASLLLPENGFPAVLADVRERLASAWRSGPVLDAPGSESLPPVVVVVSGEPPALLAERVLALAASPALDGRLLAVWSLGGAVRHDLPARILKAGGVVGVGVAQTGLVDLGQVDDDLGAWSAALAARATPDSSGRVDGVPGPFVWFY